MERALNSVVHHAAAVGKVGAQVLAVGVEHVRLAAMVSEDHQIGAEVTQRFDVANLEIHAPTLDDVFLAKTGRRLEGAAAEADAQDTGEREAVPA